MAAKPRKGRKIPDVLSEDEQQRLLAQPNSRYPTGLRNLALLRMMLDLGLRNAEVRTLKASKINFNSGAVKVLGKGKKERILYMGEETLAIVQRWLEVRAELPHPKGFLFCTLKGTQVSERYLQQMVKRYAQKAKIEKNITPHCCRHTFATDLYRRTKNLRLTQVALAHQNISTTTIYTHISNPELEEAMKGLRSE